MVCASLQKPSLFPCSRLLVLFLFCVRSQHGVLWPTGSSKVARFYGKSLQERMRWQAVESSGVGVRQ